MWQWCFPRINSGYVTKRRGIHTTISSVQLLSHVRLFATLWITARQASLSITNSRSSLKLMSIESVMPYSHLILCRPLLLLPPIPPSIRVLSNESTPKTPSHVMSHSLSSLFSICMKSDQGRNLVPCVTWRKAFHNPWTYTGTLSEKEIYIAQI